MKLFYKIFNSDSKLSSKRLQSYLVMVVMLVYIFINPITEIVAILATLVAGLQGLTLWQPKQPIEIVDKTTPKTNIGFKKNINIDDIG